MSDLDSETAILLAWLAFAVSWALAAAWSSRAQSRSGLKTEAAYRTAMIAGVVLLFFSESRTPRWLTVPLPATMTAPLWTWPPAGAWAFLAPTLAGFAFAWWARIHLGALWSGSITRKADHRVVDSGPYRLVRHPIYTGLLLAVFALAAVKATGAALAGAAVITVALWMKARFEEGFLSAELGPQAYAAYRRRVPMLVPFLRI